LLRYTSVYFLADCFYVNFSQENKSPTKESKSNTDDENMEIKEDSVESTKNDVDEVIHAEIPQINIDKNGNEILTKTEEKIDEENKTEREE